MWLLARFPPFGFAQRRVLKLQGGQHHGHETLQLLTGRRRHVTSRARGPRSPGWPASWAPTTWPVTSPGLPWKTARKTA